MVRKSQVPKLVVTNIEPHTTGIPPPCPIYGVWSGRKMVLSPLTKWDSLTE